MIAHLRGEVLHVGTDRTIVDVAGVGYLVQMGGRQLSELQPGETTSLHISTQFQKEAIQLYGFVTAQEQAVFEQLISVPNIGPKLGLALLGHLGLEALCSAISTQDVTSLSATPGVGKRTAQRLALELHDKLPAAFLPTANGAASPGRSPADPLPLALAQLGYRRSEIDTALEGLGDHELADATLEVRLSASLKILSGAAP